MKKILFQIAVSISILGTANCGSQKDDAIKSFLTLGALSQAGSLDRTAEPETIPVIPEITLPDSVQSVSPGNGSTFLLNWQDLGFKQFNATCDLVDGENTTSSLVQIKRIIPTSKIVLELQFNEDVAGGNIQLFRKGVLVPGNFTRPDIRSARFESDQPGFSNFQFVYSGVASGFTKADGGAAIPSVTWQFYTDFNGEMQKDKELITENCSPNGNGSNQCSVRIRQKLYDDVQSFVESEQPYTFWTDMYYYNPGGDLFGYTTLDCPSNPIAIKEFANEFWFLETRARLLNLPLDPNRVRADSLTWTETASGEYFDQYYVIHPGEFE
ncbi:hypothetical protein AB3N59_07585 [Leptospira sp. WS92.C1]